MVAAWLEAQESIKPLTLDLLAVSGLQPLPDLKVTPVFGGEISSLAKIKPSDLKRGKWGYRDMEGKEFIRAAYDEVQPFDQSGLAHVRLDTVWYTIDKKGDIKSKE